MRKTSHDGVDTTSITSGTENEVKKTSSTGIIKIKKSSIKRKVPSFSHESDDGIVEPLLQSDKEKSETATRSAKYLLSKTKTDSISENEDSIKISEININNVSATTPITSANKVVSTSNMINVKDFNNVSNERTTLNNHMNTNIFCESETSKVMITTKSPLLVELDAKTTGYNPSLIFTTAKIHGDCKTKLMEPVQITPVPIISTAENLASGSFIDSKHEIKDIGNKVSDAASNIFDKLNKSNKGNKDVTPTLETDVPNKALLNMTEKTSANKCEQNTSNSSLTKSAHEKDTLIKTDTKTSIFNKDLSTKNTEIVKQVQNVAQPIKSKEGITEKSGTNLPSSSSKSATEQTNNDKGDKKITIQGSKKLQRQKKATVEESQDTTSSATMIKDKLCPDENKKTTVSQTKTNMVTSPTSSSTVIISKSPNAQISSLKSNNITKNVTSQSTTHSKIPSHVISIPKNTDSKIQTPVSNNVISQPSASSKIISQAKIPETTDIKNQTIMNKNLISQPTASSKILIQEGIAPKLPDSKSQTPVSKIPTVTSPVSNIVPKSLTPTPTSKTTQQIGANKAVALNKKGENLDSINNIESPVITKSGAKESTPSTTEISSPVPKTLPPYIVSTSKTKIGAPSSAAIKSETNKIASDSKSSTNSYLVKTTPATNLKTTITTVSTLVTTSASLKLESNKLASNSKNPTTSTYTVKAPPATSLKTATSVSTSVTTGATLKSEANNLASDSKNLTKSAKATPATSIKTTTSVPTTATPSSLGTKQSVKQTKSNTEKQKGGGKA